MTLQASSSRQTKASRFNPWAHAFWQGMRQSIAVTIIVTLVSLLLYTAIPVLELIIDSARPDSTRPGVLSPSYSYMYFIGFASYLFPIIALVSALIHGVLSFRFLHGQKSSIAWFSIGLSRNDVFWSRFAAGAAGALLPAVVSLTVTLGFNLALSPFIGLVVARYVFFLIGICLQILVLYSITVAVCIRVATTMEATIYSFILCLMPSVVIVSINALMGKLLFGTPYVPAESYDAGVNTTLLGALSGWNPLLFMYPYMSVFGGGARNVDALSAKLYAMVQPGSINWLMLLVWAVVIAAIIWLARWLFLRCRVEIAGRMGECRLLAVLCVFTVGFAAFGGIYSLPFYLPKHLASWVAFASASGAAFIVMLAAALLLRLFKQPRWIGFVTVFGGLAVMAALTGLFASGGLGYSSNMPDAQNVKSATVSYNGLDQFIQEFELNQDGILNSINCSPCITLSDQGDIKTVTNIHRKLINAGRLDTDRHAGFRQRKFEIS